MSTKVGIWIDHRKAIVVDITEQGEKIEEIVSGVEKQLQRDGDRPLEGNYESVQVPDESSDRCEGSRVFCQGTFTNKLKNFRVLNEIGNNLKSQRLCKVLS